MPVIATTGGRPVAELGPVPANVRVASFIPHVHLLPKVDVMITNAGFGGVQVALANGVPLVAAGGTEEKPELLRRIVWSGAGIDLRTGTPSIGEIREAGHRVLTTPSYRQNARRMQKENAGSNAAVRAADVVESLADVPRAPAAHTDPARAWRPRAPTATGEDSGVTVARTVSSARRAEVPVHPPPHRARGGWPTEQSCGCESRRVRFSGRRRRDAVRSSAVVTWSAPPPAAQATSAEENPAHKRIAAAMVRTFMPVEGA